MFACVHVFCTLLSPIRFAKSTLHPHAPVVRPFPAQYADAFLSSALLHAKINVKCSCAGVQPSTLSVNSSRDVSPQPNAARTELRYCCQAGHKLSTCFVGLRTRCLSQKMHVWKCAMLARPPKCLKCTESKPVRKRHQARTCNSTGHGSCCCLMRAIAPEG